ncbi:MAG: hypothetical protein FJZ56_03560 [Chlamydiae bacterium]|nr:hypothetical protein [Chlamydiota bacterium]
MSEFDWRTFNPMHHIHIQQAFDEHVNKTMTKSLKESETKESRLFTINHYLSIIEEQIRLAREKGLDVVDLRKLEEGKEKLHQCWESLKEDYPDLMGTLDSPIPASLDFSRVDRDQAIRIIDQFRNAQNRDQRAIDTIARNLQVLIELYKLVSDMTMEKSKHNESRTMVHNQLSRR